MPPIRKGLKHARTTDSGHSIKTLPAVDLFAIGFDSKTARKGYADLDGKTHVIQLTATREDTQHGDLSMWLIYSAESEASMLRLWKSITDYGESMCGQIAVIDLGDSKELPFLAELMILSDQRLSFGYFELTTKNGAKGYIGYIVGNGYDLDPQEKGVDVLLAAIVANHLGPFTQFLRDISALVDGIASQLNMKKRPLWGGRNEGGVRS